MFTRRGVPWTAVFAGGLALLAASPLFQAPLPALSLDATLGQVLYAVALIGLVVGYVVAQKYENAQAEQRYEHGISLQKEQLDIVRQSHTLLVDLSGQKAAAEAGNAPPIKLFALSSGVAMAKAVATGQIATIAEALAAEKKDSAWTDAWAKNAWSAGSWGSPTQKLQTVLNSIDTHPPTEPNEILAVTKQISSLSREIPDTPSTGQPTIAETKAQIVGIPPVSSSGKPPA